MKKSTTTKTSEILTIKEFAEEYKIPVSTVAYLVQTGQVPFFRVGKRGVRFSRASLEKWAKENEGREYRLGPREKAAADK